MSNSRDTPVITAVRSARWSSSGSDEIELTFPFEGVAGHQDNGKWQAVIGHGTEIVERREQTESQLWVATPSGPTTITANRYEYWKFADGKLPADTHWFGFTQWHDNYKYTNYSLKYNTDLSGICGETREDVVKKVVALLDSELLRLRRAVLVKDEILGAYK